MGDDLHLRTRAWLAKAHRDLRSAKILAATVNPLFDTAIYHCQQAAEKSVKAFLNHQGAPVQKTHDVTRLAGNASELQAGFDLLLDDAALLSPLATSFRYPDESDWLAPLEPSRAEFDEALAAARRIYDFVLSVLPPETHPA